MAQGAKPVKLTELVSLYRRGIGVVSVVPTGLAASLEVCMLALKYLQLKWVLCTKRSHGTKVPCWRANNTGGLEKNSLCTDAPPPPPLRKNLRGGGHLYTG